MLLKCQYIIIVAIYVIVIVYEPNSIYPNREQLQGPGVEHASQRRNSIQGTLRPAGSLFNSRPSTPRTPYTVHPHLALRCVASRTHNRHSYITLAVD
jgi:hypothetical protein